MRQVRTTYRYNVFNNSCCCRHANQLMFCQSLSDRTSWIYFCVVSAGNKTKPENLYHRVSAHWRAILILQLCLSVRLSVCLSICSSRSGTVSKRLNTWSQFLHQTALSDSTFMSVKRICEILTVSPLPLPQRKREIQVGYTIRDSRPTIRYISQMIQDSAIVTMKR